METKVGPTSDIYRFFADLVRCETRLYNLFNDELREQHGIVASQFEFLRYLRDHDRARVADVAAEFAASVGAISKGTDRLEKLGWVVRRPNPSDRRSAILELSSAGRELIDAADATFRARIAGLASAALSPDQLAATSAALAALRDELERRGLGTPTG